MKLKNVILGTLVVLAIFAFAALPAMAGEPFVARKITNAPVEYFPSAAKNGTFWVTENSGQLYNVKTDGTMQYWGGTTMDSPVSYKNGIAFYTRAQMEPSVWNWSTGHFEYPIKSREWPSRPWIQPAVSQDGSRVAFATGSNAIAIYDGSTTTQWNQWDSSLWQLASLAWQLDGTILATAQNKYDADQWGYHLFQINPNTGSATDLGKGFSQVAVAGTEILLTSWNHQSLNRYWMNEGNLTFVQNIQGASYWNLGDGAITSNGTLFAALDGQYNLWAIGSPSSVPEPSSIVAMLTGIAAFGGLVRRRRS